MPSYFLNFNYALKTLGTYQNPLQSEKTIHLEMCSTFKQKFSMHER